MPRERLTVNTKLFEEYGEILRTAPMHIFRPNKECLVSFIRGYLFGREDREFTNYIGWYLNEYYQINIEHTTWVEQIDHYAYTFGTDWFDGFFQLLREILRNQYTLSPQKSKVEDKLTDYELTGESRKSIKLKNDVILKVGDFIQLSDKIGEDYKQTKFYDASLRNPSWDLFYPSERDFKHIEFYYKGEEFHQITILGKVRRIFSNSISKIEFITIQDGKPLLFTDLFVIDIEEAIRQEEVKIISQDNVSKPNDFSHLVERIKLYFMGLGEQPTLTELINFWSFYNFMYLEKNWYRYDISINGTWHKKNNSSSESL